MRVRNIPRSYPCNREIWHYFLSKEEISPPKLFSFSKQIYQFRKSSKRKSSMYRRIEWKREIQKGKKRSLCISLSALEYKSYAVHLRGKAAPRPNISWQRWMFSPPRTPETLQDFHWKLRILVSSMLLVPLDRPITEGKSRVLVNLARKIENFGRDWTRLETFLLWSVYPMVQATRWD